MKPVWGSREVLLKPESVLLCAPSSIRLQAGIFDRLVRPPAMPAAGEETEKWPKALSTKMRTCPVWSQYVSLTHDLCCCWCSNNDGKVWCDERHSGFYIFINPVFRLVQLQGHVARFLQLLQFILTQQCPKAPKISNVSVQLRSLAKVWMLYNNQKYWIALTFPLDAYYS